MLKNHTSLSETAERFYQSPEIVWNLTLRFQEFLRPELGENGLIAFSPFQRQTIGKILDLKNQGFIDQEIHISLQIEKDRCAPIRSIQPDNRAITASENCCSEPDCSKKTELLTNQVKFLWKTICKMKQELSETKKFLSATALCTENTDLSHDFNAKSCRVA